ncbi:hypothetical protein M8J77_005870 [Diaphorina citri]|nr:hypothetical protein M8J77_005870 [Diaphorina citri]
MEEKKEEEEEKKGEEEEKKGGGETQRKINKEDLRGEYIEMKIKYKERKNEMKRKGVKGEGGEEEEEEEQK